jgi:hypothetical protein
MEFSSLCAMAFCWKCTSLLRLILQRGPREFFSCTIMNEPITQKNMGSVILHIQHSIHWLFDNNSMDFQYFSGRCFMSLWKHFNEISSSSRFEETVSAGWKWYISNILNVCIFFMALKRVQPQYYFMSWRVLAVSTCCDWCHKNSFMPLFVHLNTCCVEVRVNADTTTEIYEYFWP